MSTTPRTTAPRTTAFRTTAFRAIARKTALAAMALAGAAGLALAAPPQHASANSYDGCGYPRVCFYQTQWDWTYAHPTAAYRDVTSSPQTLGNGSRAAYSVFNSRNDDGALLYYENYGWVCLQPNQSVLGYANNNPYDIVTEIQIVDSPTC